MCTHVFLSFPLICFSSLFFSLSFLTSLFPHISLSSSLSLLSLFSLCSGTSRTHVVSRKVPSHTGPPCGVQRSESCGGAYSHPHTTYGASQQTEIRQEKTGEEMRRMQRVTFSPLHFFNLSSYSLLSTFSLSLIMLTLFSLSLSYLFHRCVISSESPAQSKKRIVNTQVCTGMTVTPNVLIPPPRFTLRKVIRERRR